MKKMKKRYTNWWTMLYMGNHGKLEKQNQCTTSKQQKILFKMSIKIKLYVAQNIWQ